MQKLNLILGILIIQYTMEHNSPSIACPKTDAPIQSAKYTFTANQIAVYKSKDKLGVVYAVNVDNRDLMLGLCPEINETDNKLNLRQVIVSINDVEFVNPSIWNNYLSAEMLQTIQHVKLLSREDIPCGYMTCVFNGGA